jgi:hypothetical protein
MEFPPPFFGAVLQPFLSRLIAADAGVPDALGHAFEPWVVRDGDRLPLVGVQVGAYSTRASPWPVEANALRLFGFGRDTNIEQGQRHQLGAERHQRPKQLARSGQGHVPKTRLSPDHTCRIVDDF